MKTSKFTEAQVAFILKQAEEGSIPPLEAALSVIVVLTSFAAG